MGGFVAALVGTILVGMIPLPGGDVPPPPVAATVLAVCVTAAGWRFGRSLARTAGFGPAGVRRLSFGGAIGYGVAAAAAGSVLGVAEPPLSALVERGAAPPMFVVFALLFTGATALVALLTGAALGFAAGGALRREEAAAAADATAPLDAEDRRPEARAPADATPAGAAAMRPPGPWRLAARLGLSAAAAAALAFAAVDILMDAAGRRVGAPGAAETATMMTVMGVGLVAAAAAMGAVLGRGLVKARGG